MAWIYLVDMEGSLSASQNSSSQWPTVRKTNTLKPFCYQEYQQASYRGLPSGKISKPSPTINSSEQPISFMEGSLAKISAVLAMESVWLESEADFFLNCVDWSKKSIPDSSFWKTSQPLELEVFEKSLEHLQIWGMTVGGLVFLPRKLEPRILEKDGSYWAGKFRPSLGYMANHNLWPTPTRSDYRRRGPNSKQQGLPNAAGRGKLNPTWVEWLMGLPSEWTELKPWAMEWFRPKLKKHLKG